MYMCVTTSSYGKYQRIPGYIIIVVTLLSLLLLFITSNVIIISVLVIYVIFQVSPKEFAFFHIFSLAKGPPEPPWDSASWHSLSDEPGKKNCQARAMDVS